MISFRDKAIECGANIQDGTSTETNKIMRGVIVSISRQLTDVLPNEPNPSKSTGLYPPDNHIGEEAVTYGCHSDELHIDTGKEDDHDKRS